MLLLITIYIIAFTMLFTIFKLLRSKSIWDILLCLNMVSAQILMILAIYAVYRNNVMLLDICIAYGITGFIGISLFSAFILRGGRQK